MSITGIFLFLIFLVLFLIAAVFLFQSGTKTDFVDGNSPPTLTEAQQQQNTAVNAYLPKPVWGAFSPNSTKDGQCLAYSAVAAKFTPIPPSYAELNTGGGRGYILSNQNCLDSDQIFAQAGSHTCLLNNSGSAGSGCYLTIKTTINGFDRWPGEKVEPGVVEGGTESSPLYLPCNYPNNGTQAVSPSGSTSAFCGGSVGIIAPNFTPLKDLQDPSSVCSNSGNPNYCISLDPDNSSNSKQSFSVKLSPCDLGQFEQIFRVTRYSIDSDYNVVQDDKGNLASIVFRANGYYLAPNLYFEPINQTYQFDYLVSNPNASTDVGTETIDLILINPSLDTTRNGLYWLLQNQTNNPQYDPASTSPQQYYGCNVAASSSPIKGCSTQGVPVFYSQTSPFAPVSPQQIVYIPDLTQFPTNSLEDPWGFWTYLSNQFSINQYGSASSPHVGLQSFRQLIPVDVQTVSVSGIDRIYYYGATPNNKFPITQSSQYIDTQFLSYTNMPNAILTGISSLSGGCSPISVNNQFSSNIYNPFVAGNNLLLTTTANLSSS